MQISEQSPRSTKLKIFLFVFAFVIVIPIFYFSHSLATQLHEREKYYVDLYAKSMSYIASSTTTSGDYSFIFNELIRNINFPLIETDSTNTAIKGFRNIELDKSLSEAKKIEFLLNQVKIMDETHSPISVKYNNTTTLSNIHYGDSEIIKELEMLPIIEVLVGILFILIGYISFSYIKKIEQGNIWVGMSRETAHQLGTPLSSLLGWIEIIKNKLAQNNYSDLQTTIGNMENDLERLKKIADRFQKIGSKPNLKSSAPNEVIEQVVQFFDQRLNSSLGINSRIQFHILGNLNCRAMLNKELFEWVIENIVKNAIDAISRNEGNITFTLTESEKNIFIDIKDDGHGISSIFKKDIFRPGFSTKSRGWGLGLSLSKRIIETYHIGKLFIKESAPNKGTTFRIILPRG